MLVDEGILELGALVVGVVEYYVAVSLEVQLLPASAALAHVSL